MKLLRDWVGSTETNQTFVGCFVIGEKNTKRNNKINLNNCSLLVIYFRYFANREEEQRERVDHPQPANHADPGRREEGSGDPSDAQARLLHRSQEGAQPISLIFLYLIVSFDFRSILIFH
jgi:hypothetical protein